LHCYITRVHTPDEGKTKEMHGFFRQIQESLNTARRNNYIIIAEDQNARTGNKETYKLIGS
jgi:hypothetical protein